MQDDWNHKFMRLIENEVSGWSKDPDTQVAALVVTNNRRSISLGYNGFPRGIKDDSRLKQRDLKRKIMVHAELNAILNADFSLEGATLYALKFPCHECGKAIIQKGITTVVAYPVDTDHWSDSQELSYQLLKEVSVTIIRYKKPKEWES